MNKIKRNWPLFLLVALIYVLFNAVAFLFVKDFSAKFWFGYFYVMIAWLCILAVSILSTGDKKDRYLLNAPVIVVSVIHFIIQVLIAGATVAIESFSLKVSIVLFLIVLSIYLLSTSGLFVYKKRASKHR